MPRSLRPHPSLLVLSLIALGLQGCAFDVLGPSGQRVRDVDDPADVDAGGAVDAGGDAGTLESDGGCKVDPPSCEGKCGEWDDSCGERVSCGGCDSPETCGGGGEPNVCGCRESEAAFCVRLAKPCGQASGQDLCGIERSVDCGACTCVPESKAEFCARGGARCGAFTTRDNCNRERTETCDACPGGLTCGVDHLCHCVPESAAAFCSRLGKACNAFTGLDNCGTTRTEHCGACTSGTCVANTCVCTPESNATFCARLGKNCNSFTATDNCGASRTTNCGACAQICTQNVCTCTPPSDAEICGLDGYECGSVTLTDDCGVSRARDCGTCRQGSCSRNRCDCGPGDWATSTLETGPAYGQSLAVATRNFDVHVAYTDDRDELHPILRYARLPFGSSTWSKETVTVGGSSIMLLGRLGIGTSYTDSMVRIALVDLAGDLRLVSRAGTGPWGNLDLDTSVVDARGLATIRVDLTDTYYLAWKTLKSGVSKLNTRVVPRAATSTNASSVISDVLGGMDIAFDDTVPQLYAVTAEGPQYTPSVAVLRRTTGSSAMTKDPVGPGTLPSIAVDDQRGVHVLYAERATATCLDEATPCQTAIKYAYKADGPTNWTITTALTLGSHPNGHATRLIYKSGGRLHGLVYEFAAKKLHYLRKESLTDPWVSGVVSSGVELDQTIGFALDANSGAHVVYREAVSKSLKYAYKCP